MESKPIIEEPPLFGKTCIVCFVSIFGISASLTLLSSLGYVIEGIVFWQDLLKMFIGLVVGYLFGENRKVKS